METLEHEISLINLAGGALVEMFDQELQRVLDDAVDINKQVGKRRIVLTVDFITAADSPMAKIEVGCKSNLAPRKGVSTSAFFGQDDESGAGIAKEIRQRQSNLPFGGKVRHINGGGGDND